MTGVQTCALPICTGGKAPTTKAGGNLTFIGGPGDGSNQTTGGSGGVITLTGGTAGSGTISNGVGGAVILTGGTGTGGSGSSLNLAGGTPTGGGGNATLNSGALTNSFVLLQSVGGNLGVGLTAPTATFHVQSQYTASSTTLLNVGIVGSSTQAFTIGSPNINGYVGVATNTPGSLLSVGGVVNFTTGTTTFYANGIDIKTNQCYSISKIGRAHV